MLNGLCSKNKSANRNHVEEISCSVRGWNWDKVFQDRLSPDMETGPQELSRDRVSRQAVSSWGI